MIFDSLKNSALYYSLNPRLEKAFGFIASTDWEKMEPGIHELDGKDIYVNVMDTELKKPADAKLANPQRLSRHSGACPAASARPPAGANVPS